LLGLFAAIARRAVSGEDDQIRAPWNVFADVANQFSAKLEGGVFDIGMARELSHDWRRIEAAGEWPKP
jgi:hypothetical protein